MKYNVIVETKKATADFKRESNRWDGENQDKCLECGRIGQYFNGELKDPIGCECPYHESSNDGRLV